MVLDIDLVLVAADSSDISRRATEYATALVEQYGADLHLLHIVDTRVMRGIEEDDIAPEHVAGKQQTLTRDVREDLSSDVSFNTSGALGFSTTNLGQTPGSVILDVADDVGADLLVVPRETPSGDSNKVVGKAAYHVLEYASQPILSV